MALVNRRADKMWSFIQPKLAQLAGKPARTHGSASGSLAGLDIIDLGSGYGDFTMRALRDGADFVTSVDRDLENINRVIDMCAKNNLRSQLVGGTWTYLYADLNSKREQVLLFQKSYDVGLCLSVLPYLDFPDDLLHKMSTYCAVSIIECQYFGDGPGMGFIKDDIDMERWLSRFWHSVAPIGFTDLDIREARRTIWMCAMKRHDE